VCRDCHQRQRLQHSQRESGADLRPILHDQGGRQGHRSGPRHCPINHRGEAQREDRRRQRRGSRHAHHPAPTGWGPHLKDGRAMNRVLFVDDESALLENLRRRLYRARSKWHMTFVTSAALALEELRVAPTMRLSRICAWPPWMGRSCWSLLARSPLRPFVSSCPATAKSANHATRASRASIHCKAVRG
jgi:hypothetical protein